MIYQTLRRARGLEHPCIYSVPGQLGEKPANSLRNFRKPINCRDEGVSREIKKAFLKSQVDGACDRIKNSHSFFFKKIT